MKHWKIYIVLLLLITSCLSGCRTKLFGSQTVIDWVDFIKWDGIEYWGIHSGILADETYIGEKLGKIKYKVADNVTNPHYRIKDGDAAFHEKGTEIFTILGEPHIIAVKSHYEIHGYRLYYSKEAMDYKWHFPNIPLEQVNKVELYQLYIAQHPTRLTALQTRAEIDSFLRLLKASEEKFNFQPNTDRGDLIIMKSYFIQMIQLPINVRCNLMDQRTFGIRGTRRFYRMK
ncbi:hypothetical protein [Bacillus sp. FJAT-50079]|uniref:hypothetical protein n=1 Tax=Bacillus sp. FJAT-50079 TaxID=2833577 RepID=UPI001BCA3635|nr:hypothetical protein [Bacillus sp. FJAT-50079]MBS4209876.1 hypothetical protein [Bacillus sp. FJAT-50079]